MLDGIVILGVVAIVAAVIGLVAIVAIALNRSVAIRGDKESFEITTESSEPKTKTPS